MDTLHTTQLEPDEVNSEVVVITGLFPVGCIIHPSRLAILQVGLEPKIRFDQELLPSDHLGHWAQKVHMVGTLAMCMLHSKRKRTSPFLSLPCSFLD